MMRATCQVKTMEGHMILLHITQKAFFLNDFLNGFGQVVLMFLTGVGRTKINLG
jgi:hypothetical protein